MDMEQAGLNCVFYFSIHCSHERFSDPIHRHLLASFVSFDSFKCCSALTELVLGLGPKSHLTLLNYAV